MRKSKIPSLYNIYSFTAVLSVVNSLKNNTITLEELKDGVSIDKKIEKLDAIKKEENINDRIYHENAH